MSASSFRLLILPGDGVGREVCAQALRIIEWCGNYRSLNIDVTHGLVGGASWEAHRTALSDETLAEAAQSHAILLGAVGGPQYETLPREQRPEAGLLKLRKELDLFANLRPVKCLDGALDASTLRPEVIKETDLMIVRELTSGVYFGEPRGMHPPSGARNEERCIDTQSYTRGEITRIAEFAFEIALARRGILHSVDKANVMETGAFWRRIVSELHQNPDYKKVQLHFMYADNCAMQLIRAPRQFDVIVTDNLFGDLLSDGAAMLTGALGMLASASLGEKKNGHRKALYEPVHGSAPDIAGQNKANPLGAILSVAMMMRYSLHDPELAELIENAVASVLARRVRTEDMMTKGAARASTDGMGDYVLHELDKMR